MRAPFVLTSFCLLAGSAVAIIPSIYVWEGGEEDYENGLWSDSTHWQNGLIPPFDGEGLVFFPGRFDDEFANNSRFIDFDTNVDVTSFFFDESAYYSFYSSSTGTEIRIRDRIQATSNEYDSEILFGSGLTLIADGGGITVDVGHDAKIEVSGAFVLGVEARVDVTGGGIFLLSGDNSSGSLNGVINVTDGYLGLGHNNAAGGAWIELGEAGNPGSNTVGLVPADGDRRIANDVLVHGWLEVIKDGSDRNEMDFDGLVTFSAHTQLYNYGGILNFLGGVAETSPNTTLNIWADQPIIFTGPTNITGGINMQDGTVLFADITALPEDGAGTFFTSSMADTYVGLMIDSSTDRFAATSAFLALFDPVNFTGTIGFDTDPGNEGPINSYSAPIDLTGFASARLGSVTESELTGPITPAGDDYRFGGGGGTLLVGSLLTDDFQSEEVIPRGVDVVSTRSNPLTVFINNSENDFSGTVTAENSAVIFGNVPGALPTAATLRPSEGGYIGLQDTARSIASYLSQFDPDLENGIIGFDSADRATNRVITESIDLSNFAAADPNFFIGTSTRVSLGGPIILPETATDYRFAGFKGGLLNVTTMLKDNEVTEQTYGVVIGHTNFLATSATQTTGSDEQRHSSVRLAGANTYSGGTRLEAGELVVTNNQSLGTGMLTADGDGFGGFTQAQMFGYEDGVGINDSGVAMLLLRPDAPDLVIANAIQVNSFLDIDVQIALSDENLTLSGDISGSGGINKNGHGTLNLSGDNAAFDGGLFITAGTVNIDGDTSAGAGPIGFGRGGSDAGQNLNFNTMSPTIGGLYEIQNEEDDYYSYSNASVMLASGSTLTLNIDGLYLDFGGSIQGDGTVRIAGGGTQKFSGFNSFTGGLEIASGANFVASGSSSLGNAYPDAPNVTLDGGTLTLDGDSEGRLEANLTFGDEGGTIRGNGTLFFTNPLAIGAGVNISPGLSIGAIRFDGPLELGELGSLTVEISNGDSDKIISDVVFARTIDITASNAAPFSISLQGEGDEPPSNFDAMQAYSWSVLVAGNAITNFDATAFNLSVSSALRSLGGEGFFSFALASSGTDFTENFLNNNMVVLNFTPIPEPSTFAMVAVGLVLVTFQAGRRRRRR